MSHSIIEAAKAIIPYLSELLGEQSEPVKQQLETLLAKEADKAQVEIEIIKLLSVHKKTRAWMNDKLQGQEATKGGTLVFFNQGGDPELDKIKGKKYYKCSNDQCDYFWVKTVDLAEVPAKCPDCGFVLREVNSDAT